MVWMAGIDTQGTRRRHVQNVRRRRRLLASYAALLLTTVAAFVITQMFSRHALVARYGPNVATNLAGISLGVFVIDRLLEWRHRHELEPIRAAALRRLDPYIRSIVAMMTWTYSGARSPNEQPPSTLTGLLDGWPETVRWLDVCKHSPVPQQSWAEWLAASVAYWSDGISRVLDRHAEVLGVDLTSALEDLVESDQIVRLLRAPGWHQAFLDSCRSGNELRPFEIWLAPDNYGGTALAQKIRQVFESFARMAPEHQPVLPAESLTTLNGLQPGWARSRDAPPHRPEACTDTTNAAT